MEAASPVGERIAELFHAADLAHDRYAEAWARENYPEAAPEGEAYLQELDHQLGPDEAAEPDTFWEDMLYAYNHGTIDPLPGIPEARAFAEIAEGNRQAEAEADARTAEAQARAAEYAAWKEANPEAAAQVEAEREAADRAAHPALWGEVTPEPEAEAEPEAELDLGVPAPMASAEAEVRPEACYQLWGCCTVICAAMTRHGMVMPRSSSPSRGVAQMTTPKESGTKWGRPTLSRSPTSGARY